MKILNIIGLWIMYNCYLEISLGSGNLERILEDQAGLSQSKAMKWYVEVHLWKYGMRLILIKD